MTGTTTALEARFAQFVEHHVLQGERLPVEELCADRPDLDAPLRALIDRYLSLTTALDGDAAARAPADAAAMGGAGAALPLFDGFQTIERIGAGGMGEVFKLKDLRLDRTVAAKVVRGGGQARWKAATEGFLREARALASSPIAASSRSSSSGRMPIRPSSSWSSSTGSSWDKSADRSSSRSAPGS